MTPAELLAITAKFACLGLLVHSAELLWNWRELRQGRILHWGTLDLHFAPPAVAFFRPWLGFRPTLVTLLVRTIAGAAGLFLPYAHPATPWILGLLILTQVHCLARFAMVASAADTVFLYALVAAAVGTLPVARSAALLFLAAQLALAYASVALRKLSTRGWRTGEHLLAALRDSPCRRPELAKWLGKHATVVRFAAWSVFGTHLALAFCVVLPWTLLVSVLALGCAFHLSVAVLFGLNGFFWAFCSGYPALYFAHMLLHR